jgi:hypothetical protein
MRPAAAHGSPSSGSGLANITDVSFGNTNAADFEIHSDTRLTALKPPSQGTLNVTVAASDGWSQPTPSAHYTYF